jgi:hypothetical protein
VPAFELVNPAFEGVEPGCSLATPNAMQPPDEAEQRENAEHERHQRCSVRVRVSVSVQGQRGTRKRSRVSVKRGKIASVIDDAPECCDG